MARIGLFMSFLRCKKEEIMIRVFHQVQFAYRQDLLEGDPLLYCWLFIVVNEISAKESGNEQSDDDEGGGEGFHSSKG